MSQGEGFPRQETACRSDSFRADVANLPLAALVLVEIPPEALEPVVEEIHRPGGPPNSHGLAFPVVDPAKKAVEPADVIQMEMAEEEMVHLQDFRAGESRETALAAIEEQAMLRLPAIDFHPERVVPPGPAKNLDFECHSAVSLFHGRTNVHGERV